MDRRMAEGLTRKTELMGGLPSADSAEWMDALEGEPYIEALYATPTGRIEEFRSAVIESLRAVGVAPLGHEQRVDAVAAILDAVEELFAASQRSGAVGLMDVDDELQRSKADELRTAMGRMISRREA